MDIKLYLQITNCKDAANQINITTTVDNFMTDWKKFFCKQTSFDLIKYLCNEEVNLDRMYLKFNRFIDTMPVSVLKDPICFDPAIFIEYDFITSLNILSRLMITPIKINEHKNKWTIWVKLVNNKIHLFTAEDDNLFTEEMAKHFKLLQNYLFVRKPEMFHQQLISPLHYHTYQRYKLSIGGIELMYTAEISGINCEGKVSNNAELSTADPVYCDIFKEGEFSPEIMNYNPVWWSKAVLMKAKKCFIGIYNEELNRITNTYTFNIDKYDDRGNYENLWSQEVAWNFLCSTLLFIKESVTNVKPEFRNDCVWKVQSYLNNEDFVTCTPLIQAIVGQNITYKTLPNHALTF